MKKSTNFRIDGRKKSGVGFLGAIRNKETGKTMTEISITSSDYVDKKTGKEIPFPLLVPTLSKADVKILSEQEFRKIDREKLRPIIEKAITHAKMREKEGLDTFYKGNRTRTFNAMVRKQRASNT